MAANQSAERPPTDRTQRPPPGAAATATPRQSAPVQLRRAAKELDFAGAEAALAPVQRSATGAGAAPARDADADPGTLDRVQRAFSEEETASTAAAPASAAPVQRLAYKGAPVDIPTLTAPECGQHLGRIIRKGKGIVTGDDADYTYDPADQAAIKLRQAELKASDQAAQLVKDESDRVEVTTYLWDQLQALGGAGAFATRQPWVGVAMGKPTDVETTHAGAKPSAVVAAWRAFLGAGPYGLLDPATGGASPCRLASADGLRAIRYSSHERTDSPANLHHYHEETYSWDGHVVTITNHLMRVSISNAARDKAFAWKP